MSGLLGEKLQLVVAKAIRRFDWCDYGLDDVAEADPEWTDHLAADVLAALAKAFKN